MHAPNAPSHDSSSRAEALFLDWIESADEAEFAQLLERNAELAERLSDLRRDWEWAESLHSAPRTERPAAGPTAGPTGGRRSAATRYEIRREIGRGGMGVVFEVWDHELRRSLAVKVSRVRSGAEDTPSAARRPFLRFLDEARITAQLEHPGIVPVHELGVDREGHAYFSMRKVDGHTFGQVIELSQRGLEGWSRTRALGTLVQVCQTLAYAHSKGVVHRDLKPANVMVGRFGEVYVMDWGLAKLLRPSGSAPQPRSSSYSWFDSVTSERDERTQHGADSSLATIAGAVLGTPAYMPPEQADGRLDDTDVSGDIYAVGAMLYHLLAGERPYAEIEAGDAAIVEAVRAGPPRPIAVQRGEPPAELVAICERAMQRAPAQRYADMDQFALDLRAFLENRVVRAHQTGPIVELRKWMQRNRALAAAIGAVALLVVVALMLQVNKARQLERAARATAWENYIANIALAEHHTASGDVTAGRDALDACPLHARDWEWVYERERTEQSAAVLICDERNWFACAFHPTEPWLAAANWDWFAEVVDVRSAQRVARLATDMQNVADVEFSPDGRWIACCGEQLLVWSTSGWSLAAQTTLPTGEGAARHVAFDPSARRIATAHSDGNVRIWSLETLEPLAAWPTGLGPLSSVAWDARGERLLCNGPRDIATFAVDSGRELVRILDAETTPTQPWLSAFDPQCGRIAAGALDGAIRIWNAATGEPLAILRGHTARVRQVEFLDDDTLVSASADGSIGVWDVRRQVLERQLRGHSRVVNGIALARGRGLAASASNDGSVRLWELGGRADARIPSHGERGDVTLSPDGARLAISSTQLELWDTASGERVAAWSLPCASGAVFAPSGEVLYVPSPGGEVLGLDVATETVVSRQLGDAPSRRNSLAISPDGRWLASEQGALWDTASGELVGRTAPTRARAFGPDSDWLAVLRGERIELLDCPSLAPRRVVSNDAAEAFAIALSGDGSLLASGGRSGNLRLWSTATGQLVRESSGHTDSMFALAFLPGGTRIASGSRDRTLRLWDVATGKSVLTLAGHNDTVHLLSLSSDGRTLASSSWDGVTRVWRTRFDAGAFADGVRVAEAALSEHVSIPRAQAAVRAGSSLAPQVRAAALHALATRRERRREISLENWAVVRERGRSLDEYARAVASQREVCEFRSDAPNDLNTLGVGLYRIGAWSEAIEVLERADRLRPPTNRQRSRAFEALYIALSRDQLGEREQARREFEELLRAGPIAPQLRADFEFARARFNEP